VTHSWTVLVSYNSRDLGGVPSQRAQDWSGGLRGLPVHFAERVFSLEPGISFLIRDRAKRGPRVVRPFFSPFKGIPCFAFEGHRHAVPRASKFLSPPWALAPFFFSPPSYPPRQMLLDSRVQDLEVPLKGIVQVRVHLCLIPGFGPYFFFFFQRPAFFFLCRRGEGTPFPLKDFCRRFPFIESL